MPKTKFILHGGFNSERTEEDISAFLKEILKDAPENAKILLVLFAKDEERIPSAITILTSDLNKNKWQANITIKVATEESFLDELQSADVIYCSGGISLKLLTALKKYSNLEESVKGKIVAGESAGANVWCTFFYSPHADAVVEGLGFLPIKIIPHYKEEYRGKLDEVSNDLELLQLPENEFKIFEQ